MKKKLLVFLSLALYLSACGLTDEVCAVCEDASTGDSEEYCGTAIEVRVWKEGIEGNNDFQDTEWSCTDK